MDAAVTDLNAVKSELTAENEAKAKTVAEQDKALNTAWFVFGTKKELKAGSDYTVKQSGGEGSWKEYTYTIKKENFEKEGRYSVTIDSEDKATNKMNNKVKECNIDFVIDKTLRQLLSQVSRSQAIVQTREK